MFRQSFLLFVCMLAAGHAQTPAAPASPKPDYSQEPFITERDFTEIAFENDGTAVRTSGARVRIQSDPGIQRFAVLTFPYQNSSESLDIDYVKVTKPDGTVVVTPADNIQDLASEITRQAPMYSDLREKHVAVKGLAAGDMLEFQAHWHITKPLVPGQFWYAYNFSSDSIVLGETLQISVPRDRAVKWRSPKFQPTIAQTDKRRTFTWTGSQLERKSKEQQDKEQQIATYQTARGTTPQADIQISSFQSWEEVGRWYNTLQLERVKPTQEIRDKAADLTKGLTDNPTKARAIYHYVSTQIHYIGISFGIGRYQPHAAGEVLANQFGDCKDKHTLLAALLDAAGMQASPALISTLHDFDADLPSPGQFDHVISAVSLDGHLVWLDSTAEVGSFGYLIGNLRGKQALIMPPGRQPVLAQTPADPPLTPLHTFRIDAKLDDKGTLQGKIEHTFQGSDNEVVLRAAFRSVAMPQWKDLVQQVSYAIGFAGEISDVDIGAPEKIDQPFRIAYNYVRKDYPNWSERRVRSPLPPFAVPAPLDKDKTPVTPIWLGPPGKSSYESNVELPKGYRAELPKNIDVVTSFAEYHRSYSFKDGVMTTKRQLVVKLNEVPAAESDAYRRLTKTLDDEYARTVPLASGVASAMTYQEAIWDLPYSENKDAASAYDDARDKFNRQDAQGEIASLKRAVEIDPKFARAWLWLGEIYRARGRGDDAVAAYRKGIAADPQEPVGYKALAFTLSMFQHHDEALAAWQAFIKIAPDDSAGPAGLGTELFSQKRYQEAESAMETAVRMDPDAAGIRSALARASLHAGHPDKAIEVYRKAFELSPEPARPLLYNNAAYELAEANIELPVALEWATKAVTDEEAASRQVKLSELRVEDLKHSNSLGMYWDTLGWVYFKVGNFDQAESYLNAAWVLSQIPVSADHLGQVYERQNKKQAAIRMYKFALNPTRAKLAGGPPPGDETQERLKRLSPGAAAGDSHGKYDPVAELSAMRTTKIPALKNDRGSAEFFLIFAYAPKTAQVVVEDVKFISGEETLKTAGSALRAADFKVALPAGGQPRLLRRGILFCSPYTGCTFTLFSPEGVGSVN